MSEIIPTADGSHTVYNEQFGQNYGSLHGARGQAMHVFSGGADLKEGAKILEIGFGIGQNLRAVLESGLQNFEYLGLELYPTKLETLQQLERPQGEIWPAILAAWPPPLLVKGPPTIRIEQADATRYTFPHNWANAVFLDGFSPDVNPELWTPEFLQTLANAMASGGVLVTYSAAGRVRRALQAAGLQVEKRPGPSGKREHMRAVKP